MGLGTGVVDWLAEQAAKHGLEEGESAALHNIAEKAPEAFNAPRFVGNSAEDLSQLATATHEPMSVPNFKTVGEPYTQYSTPNPDLTSPTSSNLPVASASGPHNFNAENPGLPATIERNATPINPDMILDKQDALTLGGGALGTAGVAGTAAYLGSDDNKPQAQKAIPPDSAYGSNAGEYNTMKMLGLFPDDSEGLDDETDEPDEEDEQKKPADGDAGPKGNVSANSKQPGNTPKLSARPSIQELANLISGQSEASKANLEAALKKRDLSQLINQLGKSSEMIGDAFSRQAPKASQAFDQNIALANQNLTDYKEKVANEPNDPGSAVSQNYRKFLERYGVKVPDNVSAEQVQKVLLPAAEKQQNLEEVIQGKKDVAAQHAQYMKLLNDQRLDNRSQVRQDKLDKDTTNRIDKAGKLITAETASNRSPFGRAANAYQSAEKIQALTQNINPNDLNTYQINEIARNLDGMLANGQPSVSGMEKLIPRSGMGDASKIASYIENMPKGAQQAAFVNNMMTTVNREKDLAHDQLVRTQGKLLSPYNDLKDHPVFQQMLQLNGLPTDILNPNKGQDPKIASWAKEHSLPYDQAAAIIAKRQAGQ